jgi:hypothetical protein
VKNIDEFFIEENKMNYNRISYSKDDKYKLEILYYKIGKPENNYWNYTRGIVTNNKTGEILLDAKRNYSSFWYNFVKHNNGHEYFIFGRDYHGGYNIFDLNDRVEYSHEPEHNEHVEHFCWIEAEYDDQVNTLVVYGCYWACPFEYIEFDFSDPTVLPLKELSRWLSDESDEYDDDEIDDEYDDEI